MARLLPNRLPQPPHLHLYLSPLNPQNINWQDVQQRFQIRQVYNDGIHVTHEIFWDALNNFTLIQYNNHYFHLLSNNPNHRRLVTLRQVLRIINLLNRHIQIDWPNNNLNVHNILDTLISDAPLCQLSIYPLEPVEPV